MWGGGGGVRGAECVCVVIPAARDTRLFRLHNTAGKQNECVASINAINPLVFSRLLSKLPPPLPSHSHISLTDGGTIVLLSPPPPSLSLPPPPPSHPPSLPLSLPPILSLSLSVSLSLSLAPHSSLSPYLPLSPLPSSPLPLSLSLSLPLPCQDSPHFLLPSLPRPPPHFPRYLVSLSQGRTTTSLSKAKQKWIYKGKIVRTSHSLTLWSV